MNPTHQSTRKKTLPKTQCWIIYIQMYVRYASVCVHGRLQIPLWIIRVWEEYVLRCKSVLVSLSVYLSSSDYLSILFIICVLSVCPSVCLSIYPSIHPSIGLFTYFYYYYELFLYFHSLNYVNHSFAIRT